MYLSCFSTIKECTYDKIEKHILVVKWFIGKTNGEEKERTNYEQKNRTKKMDDVLFGNYDDDYESIW